MGGGAQNSTPLPEKLQSSKPEKAKKSTQGFIPVGDDRLEAAEKRIDSLEGELEKHKGEQKTVIIGAVVATAVAIILVLGTITVEVIIFNTKYNDGLTELQKQNAQDSKDAQDSANRFRDTITQDIVNLKLQTSNTKQQ